MSARPPVLAFVTSIRHPHNSTDYGEVESLLRQSVAAWLRQGDPRFTIIVVANRHVELPTDLRVHEVLVDFPPPTDARTARTGIAAVLRDKGTKNAIGLARARELGARHVMFVDADDFISNDVTAFVAEHPEDPGWTVTDGWRVQFERRALRRHRGDFHLQCGSSHIVRTDLLPSTRRGTDATQDELYAEQGELLERWLGSHMHIHDDLALASLPFPGALYRVGTSQSHSGNALGALGTPVSRAVAEEFGVPATGWSPLRIARSVLPSGRAVTERLRMLRRR